MQVAAARLDISISRPNRTTPGAASLTHWPIHFAREPTVSAPPHLLHSPPPRFIPSALHDDIDRLRQERPDILAPHLPPRR